MRCRRRDLAAATAAVVAATVTAAAVVAAATADDEDKKNNPAATAVVSKQVHTPASFRLHYIILRKEKNVTNKRKTSLSAMQNDVFVVILHQYSSIGLYLTPL